MVPTRRFWGLVALGLPIAGLAASAGSPYLGVLYNLAIIGMAWISGLLAPDWKGLRVRRKMDPVLSVRTSNKVTLFIENDGDHTITARIRDEVPPAFESTNREWQVTIEPGDEIERSYSVKPFERGSDFFRGTFLRIQCPFGLVVRDVKLSTSQPVRVYPNVLALREFDLLKQKGRLREIGIRRSRMRGLGTEFESLREYSEGDDYRKIDWKASARSGKVVVRQFEQERNQSVMLVIDVGRHMLSEVNGVRKLDHALDAILMLTHAAAIAGDQVGLLVFSDTVRRYIPPRKGRTQVGQIIEALHDQVAEPLESDARGAFAYLGSRWKRRSLVVAFTDLEDASRARDLMVALGPLTKRHLVLMARVGDGRIGEVLASRTLTERDMYKKSAAILLQEDRKEAESVLSAAGVHNLEAEPQELAAALVSFYFMVKERSLL